MHTPDVLSKSDNPELLCQIHKYHQGIPIRTGRCKMSEMLGTLNETDMNHFIGMCRIRVRGHCMQCAHRKKGVVWTGRMNRAIYAYDGPCASRRAGVDSA